MKRVDRHHYDPRDQVRSIYEGGLKNVFAVCHDPLPEKMEELILLLHEQECGHAESAHGN